MSSDRPRKAARRRPADPPGVVGASGATPAGGASSGSTGGGCGLVDGAADAPGVTNAASGAAGDRRIPPDQVARTALARARRAARDRGLRPGMPSTRVEPRAGASGPDARDPQLVGAAARALVADLGWDADLQAGTLAARWAQVVGPQVADHCEFVSLDAGLLTVRAASTAWKTELNLMTSALMARCDDELGPGTVVEVKVLGPTGPSFTRGRLRVPGRGPRDTWG